MRNSFRMTSLETRLAPIYRPQVNAAPASDSKPSLRFDQLVQPNGLDRFEPLSRVRFGKDKPRFDRRFDTWMYGARRAGQGVQFKLWAPDAAGVELLKIRPLTDKERLAPKQHRVLRQKLTLLKAQAEMLEVVSKGAKAPEWNQAAQHRSEMPDLKLAANRKEQLVTQKQLALVQGQVPTIESRIEKVLPMTADGRGNFGLETTDLKASTIDGEGHTVSTGSLYMYRLKDDKGQSRGTFPDPRTRFQPEDVHGPSEVIEHEFPWSEAAKKSTQTPIDVRKVTLYRMHIGTLTQEGTFEAAIKELDRIQKLGFTGIEIMPVMEFAGERNWGYDMVGFFGTENSYGRPEAFKRLINEAQKRNLIVITDNVYNHLGPEGNYLAQFDKNMVSPGSTPWGDGFNFGYLNPNYNPDYVAHPDPTHNSHPALDFVIDNAKMWLSEFNTNGSRMDMTKFIPDDALRQINKALYRERPSADLEKPRVLIIAEDARDQNFVTDAPHPDIHKWGGLGFKAQWTFGFHHHLRSLLTGMEHMGVFATVAKLKDYLYSGFHFGDKKINDLWNGVIFAESHDETGNNSGNRLHSQIAHSPGKSRIAATLQYLVPGIPYNFMGHEYGEKSPFYFFTDYADEGPITGQTKGRWFDSPQPGFANAPDTFTASKMTRREIPGLSRLTQDVLALRKSLPALWQGGRNDVSTPIYDLHDRYLSSNVLAFHRKGFIEPDEGIDKVDEVFVVANFSGHDYSGNYTVAFPKGQWQEVLNTEDKPYSGRTGFNNAQKTLSGETPINLAGNSIAVFRKKLG